MGNENPRVADIVAEILKGRDSALQDLTPQERQCILQGLKELEKGETGLADAIWALDFEKRPVPVDEFLDDTYYFGKITKTLFPCWRDELRYVLNPANEIEEWVIGGAIGIGKTWVAVIALYYKIYWLSCMRDPQDYFEIGPGSPIIFGLFNIFKYLAGDTSYGYLRSFLRLSPYFKDRCISDDKRESFVGFPHNIGIAIGAQAIHALGQNIFGGLLDEANFGKSTSLSSAEKGQVFDLYTGARRRMDSRFMQEGGSNQGLFCLISSAREKNDFLEKHRIDMAGNARTHASSFAIYEAKEEKFKNSKRFYVQIGDRTRSSRIVDTPEDAPDDLEVITVPIEFIEKFRLDLDSCIRDIAGRPTHGMHLLISRREVVLECVRKGVARKHPFHSEEIILSLEDETTIVDYLVKERLLELYDKISNRWRPKYHPAAPRAIHIDLAKNGDCAGFGMSCLSEIKHVKRYDDEGQVYTATDFGFFVDIMLRIRAAPGSEIDFRKIREFIFYLRQVEFPIALVTYDGYESVESLQELKKAGFETKTLSVDRTTVPYHSFRTILMEERVDLYEYTPFMEEVFDLQDWSLERKRPPIDHPDGGSKDITDSVAGSIYDLLLLKGSESQPARPSKEYGTPTRSDPRKEHNWILPLKGTSLNDLFEDD